MKIRNKINISFFATSIFVVSLVGLIIGFYTINFIKENIDIFFFIFFVVGLVFLLIELLIFQKITKSIEILIVDIEKAEQGDFNFETNIGMKDEIGVLAKAFDKMLGIVRESKIEIENKVKEQTKDISSKSQELENQQNAILNILEDVEREKSNAEKLSSELEKFKLAVDNVSDQIIISDIEGIIVYVNKAVETITGYKIEEVVGKKSGVLWKTPMSHEYYENMWDIIKNQKKVFEGEIQNRRKNGEPYIANISVSPIVNKNNQILFFVAIEHDITKEKEIDKAKTEFVSLASHQLRTPLSAINWYTEMLLAGDAGVMNDEQKKYLGEVAAGSKRMVELVGALLNVSRLDLGTFVIEPEPTNVVEIAKSVVTEMKPQIIEKKLKVEELYGDNMGIFQADKKLLRMVFQNLLSNAVKYTLSEGLVRIELLVVLKGQDFGGKKMTEDSLTFKISDTGMGIPVNQKDKIFSKLFRADNARETETEGTGLGLYIVKSIIDHSKGLMWFESEENKGSTFYVVFPLSGMKKKEGTKKLD